MGRQIGHNMKMQVVDYLSRRAPVVQQDLISPLHACPFGDVAHGQKHLSANLDVVKVVEHRDVLFWDHQDMHGAFRVDVVERGRDIVLPDEPGGIGDDVTE